MTAFVQQVFRLRIRGLSIYECAIHCKRENFASIRTAGIDKALAAHAEPGKLSMHFRADPSGLIALEKAEAVFETTEEYTVQVGSKLIHPRSTVTPRQNCVPARTMD